MLPLAHFFFDKGSSLEEEAGLFLTMFAPEDEAGLSLMMLAFLNDAPSAIELLVNGSSVEEEAGICCSTSVDSVLPLAQSCFVEGFSLEDEAGLLLMMLAFLLHAMSLFFTRCTSTLCLSLDSATLVYRG